MKFKLTDDLIIKFQSLIILHEMLDCRTKFDVNFSMGNEIFPKIMALGFIELKGIIFIPTDKGIKLFDQYNQAFLEFNKLFDIYNSVDVQNNVPVFAFDKYFDFDTDEQWECYFKDPKWWELRIAMCEYKSFHGTKEINPFDIIFMMFLNEGRFELKSDLDILDLLSKETWEIMLKIYEDPNLMHYQPVTGDPSDISTELMNAIVSEGNRVMNKLIQIQKNRNIIDDDSKYIETVYVEYYDDPYYISSAWDFDWY